MTTIKAIETVEGTTVVLSEGNPNRKCYTLQNLGTVPVYVSQGLSVDETQDDFCFVLCGGSEARDGRGASFNSTTWSGPVAVKCAEGTSTEVSFTEEVL